jgi:glycosyltransferase involved in cell wall biosynthesis
MIDDGSTDRTFDVMRSLFAGDPQIRSILKLSKNAGQLAAMTAGICEARGNAVIFIDSDLQLAPEELPRLLEKYDEGYDLVSGYRVNRKDAIRRVVPSKLANYIMRKVSDSDLSDFGCTFKIYNAKILRAFELGPRRLFNTATVVSAIGRYTEVPVAHFPRPFGKSGWTFSKLWKFNSDNIMNLSERPFQILGALCAGFAFLSLARFAVELVFPIRLLGEVTTGLLLNALLLATLVIIAILCIIGEFTIRTYLGSSSRPGYVVRDRISRE